MLATLRVHRRSGTLRIGNAEEIENQGENLAQALVEKQKPPGDLFARELVGVLLHDAEKAPEELEHRQQRKRLPVGNSVRLEGRQPACSTALEKLETEPALADAGLADDADHLRVSAYRPGERGFQRRSLVLTADEA